ncbi:thiamine phosphate synthase [Chelatococcus sp. SYSU_G07232]|uniref:Thiamine phosphate synthase n=1 Tax=Chelatococcus albus TaxID=3047466 RepID=A0ABT7AGM9_9HYPH|nr:thiamine phosphate synthase [Chelatococcus sp. SYSU_G07232]MDJ1158260.1 thiamine phosphate synthase [Chelatococcus sp. SYSU_G07232]
MTEPTCRLYLVTPPIADAEAFTAALAEACGAGDVAAVLLRLAAADERAQIKRVKALAPVAQDKGTAVIVEAGPVVAIRGGADGVHVSGGPDALRAALEAAKPERIVGAGGLKSKHDAMLAGETEADYLMFGEPRPDGWMPPLAEVAERARWWAEIFAVPCVAFAPTLDAVADLAATGAEFVALGDAVWAHPEGPAAAVSQALAAIGKVEVPAR